MSLTLVGPLGDSRCGGSDGRSIVLEMVRVRLGGVKKEWIAVVVVRQGMALAPEAFAHGLHLHCSGRTKEETFGTSS